MDQFQPQPMDADAPLWRITDTYDSYGPASPGQTTRIKGVKFVTRDGQNSYVEVPFVAGWQQRAIQLVDEHARELIGFVGTTSSGV